MKILAGVILLVIGLGLGYAIYTGIKPPRFQVILSPASANVGRGDPPITSQVKVEVLLEYDEVVNLTGGGVPDNVLVTFSPSSEKPTFESTMTITVGPDAPTGTHTITVRATGPDGAEATGAFVLVIE
jgi:hypothetical protein